jgi:hypothetical protein
MLILEAAPASMESRQFLEHEPSDPSLPFSEDDLRLMKSFKIRMD